MAVRFIHTADLHLGKTYRHSPGEQVRYADFFSMLSSIVADAVTERVDLVLIGGDLFHTGQILPQTFARTIETLQPLKEAQIPCVAVEGNHDWIHRRESISWMEALSQMGYLRLLRPSRSEDGGYFFDPFDTERGAGGHLVVGDLNIYGLGYIGAQAGAHVERICEAVTTDNNLLLFHVGIWSFSPVEIGNMKPEEALPLAKRFGYLALGHGHKPYLVETPDGRPYGFNPGSPERVNFGEQKYPKGYYLVSAERGRFEHEFRATDPRPMLAVTVDLDGAADAGQALGDFRQQLVMALEKEMNGVDDERRPLIDLRLVGKVAFHPFELGRERLWKCWTRSAILSMLKSAISCPWSVAAVQGGCRKGAWRLSNGRCCGSCWRPAASTRITRNSWLNCLWPFATWCCAARWKTTSCWRCSIVARTPTGKADSLGRFRSAGRITFLCTDERKVIKRKRPHRWPACGGFPHSGILSRAGKTRFAQTFVLQLRIKIPAFGGTHREIAGQGAGAPFYAYSFLA
ncbi:MAG: exonuclease SbcCD subunit D [Syntrophotaleaceae bacterium]